MKKFVVFLASSLVCVGAYAEVRTVDSLQPIEQEISCIGKEGLVLLDIGHTLIVHNDAVMDPRNEKWKVVWFQKNYPVPNRERHVATVRIVESATENWTLVDNAWPEVIKNAQSQGTKVVALTRVLVDPSLYGIRGENLSKLGIALKDDLMGLSSGQTYHYANGVIETEAKLKGPVLEEFLPKLLKVPSKIIFVDDRIEQAESIDQACQAAGIPCISFHYTAYQKVSRPLDEKVADYQLRTLLEEYRWVPEAEAKRTIAQKSLD